MIKYIIALSALLLFASCTTKQVENKEMNNVENNMTPEESKQPKQEVEIDGSPALLGEITEEDLMGENYVYWYEFYHSEYTVNQGVVDEFKNELQDLDIRVFIGTWCSDSQERTPAFFKILDAANYPKKRVQM